VGRSSPESASAGSVVGRPSASVAQVAGISRPSDFARRIFPSAASDSAMSRTTGSPTARGIPMARGLLPTTGAAPPGAGIRGLVLAAATPMQPAAVAASTKRNAPPKWNAWRTVTSPMPCCCALPTASAMAASPVRTPRPCPASSSATAPRSTIVSGCSLSDTDPRAIRSRYIGTSISPCEPMPRWSASTRAAATACAASSERPAVRNSMLVVSISHVVGSRGTAPPPRVDIRSSPFIWRNRSRRNVLAMVISS